MLAMFENVIDAVVPEEQDSLLYSQRDITNY